MTTERLAVQTTQLDGADGAAVGQVVLGPVPAWETWKLSRLVVVVNDGAVSGDATPTATVYLGEPAGAQVIDATWTGQQDVSDFASPLDLPSGFYLTVMWTLGPSAGRAVAQLYGTRERNG